MSFHLSLSFLLLCIFSVEPSLAQLNAYISGGSSARSVSSGESIALRGVAQIDGGWASSFADVSLKWEKVSGEGGSYSVFRHNAFSINMTFSAPTLSEEDSERPITFRYTATTPDGSSDSEDVTITVHPPSSGSVASFHPVALVKSKNVAAINGQMAIPMFSFLYPASPQHSIPFDGLCYPRQQLSYDPDGETSSWEQIEGPETLEVVVDYALYHDSAANNNFSSGYRCPANTTLSDDTAGQSVIIPKGASLGRYRFRLTTVDSEGYTIHDTLTLRHYSDGTIITEVASDGSDGSTASESSRSSGGPTGQQAGLSIDLISSPSSGAPGESLTLVFEVTEGGSPAQGQTVSFSVSPSITSSLSPTSATTGSDGQVSTTLTLGNSISGSYTTTASVGSQSASVTISVSVPPEPPEPPGPVVDTDVDPNCGKLHVSYLDSSPGSTIELGFGECSDAIPSKCHKDIIPNSVSWSGDLSAILDAGRYCHTGNDGNQYCRHYRAKFNVPETQPYPTTCYDILMQYNRNNNGDTVGMSYPFGIISIDPAAAAKVFVDPDSFWLSNNYPNPFNPATTIEYALPQAADVELAVYNVVGQVVRTLVAEHQSTGYYAVEWDATGLPSGMYFSRLQAGEFHEVKKMLLLK